MKYYSTRGGSSPVSLSEAIEHGLATDGGLYVPEHLPKMSARDFDQAQTLPDIAKILLAPFVEGDVLATRLPEIIDEALDFDVPLVDLDGETALLELFHGPTAAFKDVGARFLASCSSRLNEGTDRPLTILVATSGDTGGAVAAAFDGKPNVEVIVLYPAGKVSPRQEHQLTCWGDNVEAFAVEGTFDDCQRIAKEAFADPWWQANRRLSSANSINIGRILPQMTYYAAASLWFERSHGHHAGFVVPTGNLGNALACIWVREMGLPIRDVVLATNANRSIPDFLETRQWQPRPSVQTLATAMDVGNPSNMERLRCLFPGEEALASAIRAIPVDDHCIEQTIREGSTRWNQIFCPHTATAVYARQRLDQGGYIVVATAHPAKFEQIVEPLIGHAVDVPPALSELLDRPTRATSIEPTLEALTRRVSAPLR
jgi:threonine synthase